MANGSAFPTDAPTSEGEWLSLVGELDELPLSTRPVVVVAPHPDDETLAVGGLIATLRMRGVSVDVVAVTDGEGSHPHRPDMATRRRHEQDCALVELGVQDGVHRLGLPDGRVADHGDVLERSLVERIGQATILVAPWEHDGHTDHDACGAAARRAAVRSGASRWSYPVWAWQWAVRPEVASLALRKVTLGEEARRAKSRAIGHHSSQTQALDGPPVVGPEALRRFQRPWEVIIDER